MSEEKTTSLFDRLSRVDVSGKTEQKAGLTYLSWAWAWSELKKLAPDAHSTVYETPEGMPYWTDGRTCWVKVGVTAGGLEHIEYFPIMDHRNQSIPRDKVSSTDWNKSVQRAITKCIARHGLGLNVYAGEDLPMGLDDEEREGKASLKDALEKSRQASRNASGRQSGIKATVVSAGDEEIPF